MDASIGSLTALTQLQLKNLFAYEDGAAVERYAPIAFDRAMNCFSHYAKEKYYRNAGGGVYFSQYHSGQYAIYLWYLSKAAAQNGNDRCATVLYCLNKALHAVDWYYEIDLPDRWMVEHPVGSVLGRAKYGNGLMIYQCSTVGGVTKNGKTVYPVLGENVTLFAHAGILGDCRIGSNVALGAGTLVKNQDIPDNSIVFGQSPSLIIKAKD